MYQVGPTIRSHVNMIFLCLQQNVAKVAEMEDLVTRTGSRGTDVSPYECINHLYQGQLNYRVNSLAV